LTRPADYQRFIGSRVKLTTRAPVNGSRHFQGRLEKFEDGRVTLDLSGPKKKEPGGAAEVLDLELANIEKANLVPEI
jgi:ribosome maturation factor RimP